ncbi:MAG: universal stress protein [Gammaproteobacteria bacterium]|nr:universal stress protein [Gammaproteobacteria bacterium]
MAVYQNILLAVDLHPSCQDLTTECAVEFAKAYNAKLSILHVVEPIHAYSVGQAYPMVTEVEDQIANEAKKALSTLSKKYGIPHSQQIVEMGPPVMIILDNAKKLNADLIVLGSHGRHGIRLLLGSTANGVIHLAQWDVLAVRMKE